MLLKTFLIENKEEIKHIFDKIGKEENFLHIFNYYENPNAKKYIKDIERLFSNYSIKEIKKYANENHSSITNTNIVDLFTKYKININFDEKKSNFIYDAIKKSIRGGKSFLDIINKISEKNPEVIIYLGKKELKHLFEEEFNNNKKINKETAKDFINLISNNKNLDDNTKRKFKNQLNKKIKNKKDPGYKITTKHKMQRLQTLADKRAGSTAAAFVERNMPESLYKKIINKYATKDFFDTDLYKKYSTYDLLNILKKKKIAIVPEGIRRSGRTNRGRQPNINPDREHIIEISLPNNNKNYAFSISFEKIGKISDLKKTLEDMNNIFNDNFIENNNYVYNYLIKNREKIIEEFVKENLKIDILNPEIKEAIYKDVNLSEEEKRIIEDVINTKNTKRKNSERQLKGISKKSDPEAYRSKGANVHYKRTPFWSMYEKVGRFIWVQEMQTDIKKQHIKNSNRYKNVAMDKKFFDVLEQLLSKGEIESAVKKFKNAYIDKDIPKKEFIKHFNKYPRDLKIIEKLYNQINDKSTDVDSTNVKSKIKTIVKSLNKYNKMKNESVIDEAIKNVSTSKFTREWMSKNIKYLIDAAKKEKATGIIINGSLIQQYIENMGNKEGGKAKAVYDAPFKQFVKGFKKIPVEQLKSFPEYKNNSLFGDMVDRALRLKGENKFVWIADNLNNIKIIPSTFKLQNEMLKGGQGSDQEWQEAIETKKITRQQVDELLKRKYNNKFENMPTNLLKKLINNDKKNQIFKPKEKFYLESKYLKKENNKTNKPNSPYSIESRVSNNKLKQQ